MNLKSSPYLKSHKNNCFLIAMKEACSWLDEQKIIDVGIENGFYKPNSGSVTAHLTKYMRTLGIMYKIAYRKEFGTPRSDIPTIKRFIDTHLEGVFILGVNGHALVLNNGRIVDPNLGNYGIQRKVEVAYEILNADLKAEPFSWDQDTRFKKCNRNVSGFGFKTGSRNHTIMSQLVREPFIMEGVSFRELKSKYPELSMDQFVYFVNRGIFRPIF